MNTAPKKPDRAVGGAAEAKLDGSHLEPETPGLRRITHCPACGAEAPSHGGSHAQGLECLAGETVFFQPDYTIYPCPECGLLYKSIRLSDAELDRYYCAVDFAKWEQDRPHPTERIARRWLDGLADGAAVLDFGCSSGRLLGPLAVRLDCYGVETNPAAAAAAEAKGLTMLTLETAQARGAFLDCLVLMDVFEHLAEPVGLLKALKSLLKPSGTMIIATGDSDFPICSADPANFWYFRTVEHLCMLNAAHAAKMQGMLDMKLVAWTPCSHYDSTVATRGLQYLRYFAHRLYSRGSPLIRGAIRLVPLLGRVSRWPSTPPVTLGRDHVVAVFQA